jgi:hypothetical protein
VLQRSKEAAGQSTNYTPKNEDTQASLLLLWLPDLKISTHPGSLELESDFTLSGGVYFMRQWNKDRAAESSVLVTLFTYSRENNVKKFTSKTDTSLPSPSAVQDSVCFPRDRQTKGEEAAPLG